MSFLRGRRTISLLWTSLAISMALHFITGAFYLWTDQPKKLEPLVLEFETLSMSKTAGQNSEKKSSAVVSKLEAFPKYNYGQIEKSSPSIDSQLFGSAGKSNSQDSSDAGFSPYYSPIETLQDAVDLDPFYAALLQKINASMTYLEDLSKNYHKGSIRVQFEVNGEGQMTGNKIRVESEDEALETYVLYSLVTTLSDSLQVKVWSSRTSLPVNLEINFVQLMPTSQRQRACCQMVGHHLEISKFDYIEPQLLPKDFDRLVRKYWPPVIITPFGASLDLVRLYTMIKESQELDKNESRDFRVDNLKKIMNQKLFEKGIRPTPSPN